MAYRWIRKRTGEPDRATYETKGLEQEIKLVIHDRGFNIRFGDSYISSSVAGDVSRFDLDNLKESLKGAGVEKLPEIPKKYIPDQKKKDFV